MHRQRLSPEAFPSLVARLFLLLFAVFILAAPGRSLAQSVSATMDDGVPAGTYKQVGDTITYTIGIANSGGAAATGVTLTDPTPANTTLVGGSLHASPLANHDGPYTAVGNTKLYVGVAAPAGEPALVSASPALFANDVTITDTTALVSNTQPSHGAVTVNSDGSFVYTPTVGYTGADSFTYTLKNNADATLTDTGTVTITVSNLVWYVNNSGANGDGRSTTPFNTLAGAAGASAANSFIYVYKGSGAYTGGLTLKSGQTLTSEFVALVVGGNTLRAAVPANTPTLSHTTASTVALSTGNTIDGFIITNSAGNGISGSAIGTTAIADIAVTVTGGTALNATTSGTLTVTGSLNTLSSTNGAALNVANVAIGASGLTFKSIATNGGTNGIVLNNTGATAGLTVTGDGNTSVGGNSSGGVIQNTTNHGISLTSTLSPSFTNMSIHDIARNGINGTGVVNFTFDNGQITNTGTGAVDQYNESAIAFVDAAVTANTVSGNVTITDSLISGARRNAIMIETWNGTISNVNISNNTLSGASAAAALKNATLATTSDIQDAIHVFAQGSASQTSHITTGTINNNTISGFEFFSGGIFIGGNGIRVAGGSGNGSNATVATLGSAANPIVITGNDVDDVGSNAIAVSFNGQNGLSNFNIHHNGTVANPMSNAEGLGISVFFGGSGTFSALVNNNAVNNNGPTVHAGSSGIAVQLDDGPAGLANSTGVATIHVNNNTVTNPDGFGIRGIARASNGTLNLYVQNNDVGTPVLTNREAIRIDSGSAAGDVTLNLNMTGNSGPLASTTDNLVGAGVDAGIGVRKQGTVATVNEFNIQGITANPTNDQVSQFIRDNNHTSNAGGAAPTVSPFGVDIISGSNYGTTNTVPLLFAAGGVEADRTSGANVSGGASISSESSERLAEIAEASRETAVKISRPPTNDPFESFSPLRPTPPGSSVLSHNRNSTQPSRRRWSAGWQPV